MREPGRSVVRGVLLAATLVFAGAITETWYVAILAPVVFAISVIEGYWRTGWRPW